ncbi:MAG: hypothetical protein AB8G14_12515 [Ilumatobacter sp.]
MGERADADVAAETVERLGELGDMAELMGDDAAALQFRRRAASIGDRAMERLDDD